MMVLSTVMSRVVWYMFGFDFHLLIMRKTEKGDNSVMDLENFIKS